MQKKLVLIRLMIDMAIEVPVEWDKHEINFYLNDSSNCLANQIDQLYAEVNQEKGICKICSRAEGKYLQDMDIETAKQTYAYIGRPKS